MDILAANNRFHLRDKMYIVMGLFLSVSCPLIGQEQIKKNLEADDYTLWSTLTLDKMSPNGHWLNYSLEYVGMTDTLFVKSTLNKASFAFPSGKNGSFANNKYFACLLPNGKLNLLNLNKGSIEVFDDVVSYSFLSEGNYLAITTKKDRSNQLLIKKTEGKMVETFYNVVAYSSSHGKNKMVLSTKRDTLSFITLLSFEKNYKKSIVAMAKACTFQNLTWQQNDNAITFLKEASNTASAKNELLYYSLNTKKTYSFIEEGENTFPSNRNIVNHDEMELKISDDGKKVFFSIKEESAADKVATLDKVQIWNGNDKFLYPLEQKIDGWKNVVKTAVWFPEKRTYRQVTSDTLPWLALTANQTHSLTGNPKAYEPQYKYFGDMDYYLTDLETGYSFPLLEKQSGDIGQIGISSLGKYICYYRQKNWWIYNIKEKTHLNVTKDTTIEWDDSSLDPGNDIAAFGNPGWTTHNELILYDQYDIWVVNPKNGKKRRITQGREKNSSFKLSKISGLIGAQNYKGRTSDIYNFEKTIVLEANGLIDGASGYFLWSPKNGEKPFAYSRQAYDQIQKASRGNRYAIRSQAYDKPPSIVVKSSPDHLEETIMQSNPQHEKYYWGTSKMIYYFNPTGLLLRGALFYPANYNPSKKYPMIVYIYEKQSRDIYRYQNPSKLNLTGINITNLVTKGYFVLLPDIVYVKGDTGVSALDCVVAATNKVIEMNIVQKNKIGLLGHSFGGYETNFIVTQTNIFSAAVSGAGVSDLTSWYLSLGWNTGKPDMWRLESQQWRMGKSFYDDQESYYRNSPIIHATKIQTPLLLWAGKLDLQVDWHQTMEFYLALRRLEKKNIMLLYPNEQHVLFNAENQIDLTNRIEQWFDYHLKDNKTFSWISKGINE